MIVTNCYCDVCGAQCSDNFSLNLTGNNLQHGIYVSKTKNMCSECYKDKAKFIFNVFLESFEDNEDVIVYNDIKLPPEVVFPPILEEENNQEEFDYTDNENAVPTEEE